MQNEIIRLIEGGNKHGETTDCLWTADMRHNYSSSGIDRQWKVTRYCLKESMSLFSLCHFLFCSRQVLFGETRWLQEVQKCIHAVDPSCLLWTVILSLQVRNPGRYLYLGRRFQLTVCFPPGSSPNSSCVYFPTLNGKHRFEKANFQKCIPQQPNFRAHES